VLPEVGAEILVRPRVDEDLPLLAAAIRSLHETDGYPQTLPDDTVAWLRPPRQRRAWVAVSPSTREIAGHIALNVAEGDPGVGVSSDGTGLKPDKLAVVSRLFVVAGHRRKGVAKALLDEAVNAAHADGLQPVLDVLEADRAAITLYKSAGWRSLAPIMFRSRAGEPLPALVFAGPPPPDSAAR
jgi:GNAT superfamily N-acetyltransferase